jgi:hypothetical protein
MYNEEKDKLTIFTLLKSSEFFFVLPVLLIISYYAVFSYLNYYYLLQLGFHPVALENTRQISLLFSTHSGTQKEKAVSLLLQQWVDMMWHSD